MRFLFLVIISILWTPAKPQDTISIKKDIDAEVRRIDHDSSLQSITFSIQAMKKVLHFIKYNYTAGESGFIKINRQFSRNNDTIRQEFYCKKGELIFASELILSYYTEGNKTDSIGWSGDFYFSKNKLIDHITLGHGKSELDNWDPEQDILTAFNESIKDIGRYKKKKNSN